MLKKILIVFFIFFLLALPSYSGAQESVTLELFWSEGCPHCAKEKVFLETIKDKYPNLIIKEYEISKIPENQALLQQRGEELNADTRGVPFTVIGDKFIIGYQDDKTTGKAIERTIQKTSTFDQDLNIPLVGNINLKNLSLPAITLIIAALDGFNPCAMWILIFLISLLIGMQDRKRMWILGSAFIISSALVYFLFMSAWLNIFLFLGFIGIVRIIIGFVAFGSGVYNLKEYLTNKDATCKVTGGENRKRIFEKLKEITHKKSFLLALFGIILLAFAVNLVELICSAGLPAVYTQILSLNNLHPWQYYLYLLLYIFVFMLDDLLVFVISMKTLEITGLTTRYSRYSHLIGGILMLILGLLLIFKPSLLMFG